MNTIYVLYLDSEQEGFENIMFTKFKQIINMDGNTDAFMEFEWLKDGLSSNFYYGDELTRRIVTNQWHRIPAEELMYAIGFYLRSRYPGIAPLFGAGIDELSETESDDEIDSFCKNLDAVCQHFKKEIYPVIYELRGVTSTLENTLRRHFLVLEPDEAHNIMDGKEEIPGFQGISICHITKESPNIEAAYTLLNDHYNSEL